MADKTQEGSFTSTLPGGSPLYFKVKTTYKTDATGNPIRGSATHTLLYNPGNNQYYPAATTTDFKTFELKKYTPAEIVNAGIAQYAQPDGTVLGPTAAQSLQTSGGQLNKEMRNATALSSINNGLSVGQAQAVNNAPQTLPNAPVPDPASGETQPIDEKKTQENLNELSNLKISDRDNTRNVSEYPDNLKYPISLRSEDQDCIKFTMLQYAPRKIDIAGISQGDPLSERSTTQNRTRGKTVILPIQPTISDNNTVKWGSSDMDAGQLIAASVALASITEGAEGATASIKQITDLFKGSASDLKTAFAAGFADAAVGTKGLLTRVTGGIVNPNTELLFQGPDLRTFNFTFSLSAREADEAKVIRNIIRFFKQGMSVKRASTGLFLKSPHTFEIKYFHKGSEHPWLNKIKECALTSCNVNYTPAGNYATYEDGAMTQYDITLSFSELEPIYDDEYGKGSTTYESEIGF